MSENIIKLKIQKEIENYDLFLGKGLNYIQHFICSKYKLGKTKDNFILIENLIKNEEWN